MFFALETDGPFLAGRDAQLEKAVQVLQDELKNKKQEGVKTASGN